MDIGDELRRARNARKLSLDDIARATRVSQSILRALEANAFEKVPGGLFTRGYLRAYAAQVGLDSELIVAAYRAECDPPVAGPMAPAVAPADALRVARRDSEEQETSSRHSEILQFSVVMVVAVLYLASLRQAKPPADRALADAVAASVPAFVPVGVDPGVAQPVATSGSTPATQQTHAIDIHPSGPCWVDVTVGGAHPISRLMNAGDRETVTVQGEITLRVGDPAAFSFSIDGVTGRSLGPEGHPVTVRITPSNYRMFLATANSGG